MQKQVEQYREQAVLNALKNNKGLSTISDIETILRRRQRIFYSQEITGAAIAETLHDLIPYKVRLSGVQNNRGSHMYAPADRTPSKREERVGSSNPFVGAISRWWYVGVRKIRTCDL